MAPAASVGPSRPSVPAASSATVLRVAIEHPRRGECQLLAPAAEPVRLVPKRHRRLPSPDETLSSRSLPPVAGSRKRPQFCRQARGQRSPAAAASPASGSSATTGARPSAAACRAAASTASRLLAINSRDTRAKARRRASAFPRFFPPRAAVTRSRAAAGMRSQSAGVLEHPAHLRGGGTDRARRARSRSRPRSSPMTSETT